MLNYGFIRVVIIESTMSVKQKCSTYKKYCSPWITLGFVLLSLLETFPLTLLHPAKSPKKRKTSLYSSIVHRSSVLSHNEIWMAH